MSKNQLMSLLIRIIGRSIVWRLGRSLYMSARGEIHNDIHLNGEETLLTNVALISAQYTEKLTPAIVVDCGANLGDWTAVAIDKFKNAGVPAKFLMFEPSPRSCERITERFKNVNNIAVYEIALSNETGISEFFMESETGGTNSLVPLVETHKQTISVRTEKGSDYLMALGATEIALFKIDTEGNDFAVLEGLKPMLVSHQIKVIQFEYNHRWLPTGRSMRSVFELAHMHGYDVGRTDPRCIEVYADWNPEIDRFFEWNYILLAPEMAEQLNARRMRWDSFNTLVPA